MKVPFISRDLYQSIVLLLLRFSNHVAIMMILIAFFICFSTNMWLYAVILGISSVYLGWLTGQYVISENSACNTSCSFQYGCQVASFNSRLSIISNVTITLIGVASTYMIVRYLIWPVEALKDSFTVVHVPYLLGIFKLLLIYMISDKIHSSHLLMSVLYRYSQSIRFLNIDVDRNWPDRVFPLIFLDGAHISPNRYRVTTYGDKISVVFEPALSINDNSSVEYQLIPDDDCGHVVYHEPVYDKYLDKTCFFRCHVVVKNVGEKKPYESDRQY